MQRSGSSSRGLEEFFASGGATAAQRAALEMDQLPTYDPCRSWRRRRRPRPSPQRTPSMPYPSSSSSAPSSSGSSPPLKDSHEAVRDTCIDEKHLPNNFLVQKKTGRRIPESASGDTKTLPQREQSGFDACQQVAKECSCEDVLERREKVNKIEQIVYSIANEKINAAGVVPMQLSDGVQFQVGLSRFDRKSGQSQVAGIHCNQLESVNNSGCHQLSAKEEEKILAGKPSAEKPKNKNPAIAADCIVESGDVELNGETAGSEIFPRMETARSADLPSSFMMVQPI